MATNSLIIKDGNSVASALSMFSSSTGLVPEHVISGAVNITASSANPAYITGAVNIGNFPVATVTSSTNNPVLVTGSLQINNFPTVTTVTSSQGNPVSVTFDNNFVDNNRLRITGSVSADLQGSIVNVSASLSNPVGVLGTVTVQSGSNPIKVTATSSDPVYTRPVLGLSTSKNRKSTFEDVVYTNETSGTFELATADSSRIGLIISNSDQENLYITLGSGSKNGFSLNSTASAPTTYSFILYPSGTYIADFSTVGLFHGGFFISSSNVAGAAIITTITP